jgi:hypothetical protein
MKALAITSCLAILFANTSAIGQARKTEVTTFQLGDQLTVIPAPDGFEEAASQCEFIRDHLPGSGLVRLWRQTNLTRVASRQS